MSALYKFQLKFTNHLPVVNTWVWLKLHFHFWRTPCWWKLNGYAKFGCP